MNDSRSFAAAALLGLLCVPWSDASAKDIKTLARVLIPAYMAQDFAVLCGTQDAFYLSAELNDGIRSVAAYAQHVKKEVTIDVPEQDAAQVRLTAADVARQIARQELYILARQQVVDPTHSLNRWCERSAKPFILEIMTKHDEKHRQFDEIVERAKR